MTNRVAVSSRGVIKVKSMPSIEWQNQVKAPVVLKRVQQVNNEWVRKLWHDVSLSQYFWNLFRRHHDALVKLFDHHKTPAMLCLQNPTKTTMAWRIHYKVSKQGTYGMK
eukprot:CAMPEP_0175906272 /NCGR_PEP_ID=MMETSP0108-20121206/5458_1 /TAXON_ID=195067 ORGANISM="Goniomonas pacifica, Strain CCMP1869" /NCGR_SAMPLE_ID=MMETSP0108 /ASSEMBLY_ACC=CAM_ASM_000204 /LENGTH=108 /DNA_ID=CAMNT_0017228213 /DNA_START=741 /DNA_END=1066 /DNA_ORIENTATION=-